MKRALRLAAAALLAAAAQAQAQSVSLHGSMGERAALLVINGQPRTLAVGATHEGVRLVSVDGAQAVVEVDGRRVHLGIGAPVSIGPAAPAAGGQEIVLTAGPGGHFVTGGSIDGKPVQFIVDTGATTVTLSQADADRIGLAYRHGPRTLTHTANGVVPAHRVTLSSVRVGDVVVANVPALVLPAPMEHVLLGNSFLTRFQMTRENDTLRLRKRP